MTTALVVQARTGSSRLPGKVLLPLAGRPLLERLIERIRAASERFELIVATTALSADEPIRKLCRSLGVRVFSGHPTDLLDRHLRAAEQVSADVVVKIPSDCPLIDPAVIDRVLGYFKAHRGDVDFVGNLRPATWPDGNDVEVMRYETLSCAWREAERPFEREHTTPFIWMRPERFRAHNVTWETGLDYSKSHRFTIDYAEDYALIARIYARLYEPGRVFSLEAILDLLRREPALLTLNARHLGKSWQLAQQGELECPRCP